MNTAARGVAEQDPAPAAGEPMVRLEGVRKSFGDNLVLDGIDLAVDQGDVLVIIGRSGSGKSTLLRCVNLLEPLDSGSIHFEGEEITRRGTDVSRVRQRIGMVFQQFNLFPHRTALENVIEGPVTVKRMPRTEAIAWASGCWSASGWPTSATSTRRG